MDQGDKDSVTSAAVEIVNENTQFTFMADKDKRKSKTEKFELIYHFHFFLFYFLEKQWND